MRFFSEPNSRFLAMAVSLSVVALGSTFLLTGCGSGSGNASLPGGTVGGGSNIGSNSSYASRSYTVTGLVLPSGVSTSVTLQVSATNSISGTFILTALDTSVPLSGTLNTKTGAFQLTGTLPQARSVSAGKTAAATRQTGDTVTVTGTLPTPPATTGGSLTLAIDGASVTAPFRSSSSTSSPSMGSGTGSGTYGDYFNGFASSANDTFTFQYTTTNTESPDPRGENSGPKSGTNTIKGPLDAFGTPFIGQNKTTVTIALPVSGSKTVTREEYINAATGKVFSYHYYIETASGRTDYGSDELNDKGKVTSSTRYEGGAGGGSGTVPYNLAPGQSFSSTDTDYEMEYDDTGAITEQYSYQETGKITFVGIETVTVAAGTYTNVAHFRFESSYIDPATNTGDVDRPHNDTDDFYISKYAGRIKAVFHDVTQNEQGSDSNGNPYTYTSTFDGTNELASATINGTNYPPGRSVRVGSSSSPLPSILYSWPFHHRHQAH